MVWLPDGEKISKTSLYVLTQLTNVTDTQTPHDGIGRAIASRGKKRSNSKGKIIGKASYDSLSGVILYTMLLTDYKLFSPRSFAIMFG